MIENLEIIFSQKINILVLLKNILQIQLTNPAPYDLALKFSVEQYYYAKPFGLHKAWLYLSKEKWAQLKKDCPEINLVFPDNEINQIKNVFAHRIGL